MTRFNNHIQLLQFTLLFDLNKCKAISVTSQHLCRIKFITRGYRMSGTEHYPNMPISSFHFLYKIIDPRNSEMFPVFSSF